MRPWSLLVLLGCGGEGVVPHAPPDVTLAATNPGEIPSAPPTPVLMPLGVVSSAGPEAVAFDDGEEDTEEYGDQDGDGMAVPPPPPKPVPVPKPVPPPPAPVEPESVPVPPVPAVVEPVPSLEPDPPVAMPIPMSSDPSPTDLLQQQARMVTTQTTQQEQQVDALNDELLVIVNKLRAEKGLPPLPALPEEEPAAAAPP